MALRNLFEKDNFRLVPLALWGAGRGLGEVYVKPVAGHLTAWIGHLITPNSAEIDMTMANMTYYSTGEPQDDPKDLPDVREGN